MPIDPLNPNLSPHLRQLQNSVAGVQATLRRFDALIHGEPQRTSSSRRIRGSRGEGEERNVFEQLAMPLLRNAFGSLVGKLSGNPDLRSSASQLANRILGGGSPRSSQGQSLADLAAGHYPGEPEKSLNFIVKQAAEGGGCTPACHNPARYMNIL